jgi:hypothetical protein
MRLSFARKAVETCKLFKFTNKASTVALMGPGPHLVQVDTHNGR